MGYEFNPDIIILPWPKSVECNKRVLTRTGKSTAHVSPFSKSTQTQELVGGVWTLNIGLPPLDNDEQRAMRVFIARLAGTQGYFYFPAESTVASIPARDEPPEDGEPYLLAQGRSNVLETGGWEEPEGVLLVSAGEYISYDDAEGWRRLHVVVQDCYAGVGGAATLRVEPPVRTEILAGAALHIGCPSGIFKLAGDGEGAINQSPESGSMSIAAVEAFPPRVTVL